MLLDRIATLDIGPLGGSDAVHLEGLRITFRVRKDRDKTANTAEIEVYNLSKKTRDAITETEEFVVLKAGYVQESGAEVLFIGNIVSVTHLVQSPDVVTRIEANDGDKAVREQRVSLSVSEGGSVKGMLDSVLAKLGLPVKTKNVLAKVQDQKFLQGFAFIGRTADAIDALTKRLSMEYSVQNNETKILEEGGSDDTDAIPINAETGMVGSPERQRQLESEINKDKKPPGWKVTCVLHPKLEPGGRIALKSEALPTETFFGVDKLEHHGDTHGQDWTTVVEVSDKTAIKNLSGVGVV